jgi:hypothetical protein
VSKAFRRGRWRKIGAGSLKNASKSLKPAVIYAAENQARAWGWNVAWLAGFPCAGNYPRKKWNSPYRLSVGIEAKDGASAPHLR